MRIKERLIEYVTSLSFHKEREMRVRWINSQLLLCLSFFTLIAGPAFAQPGKDKVVTVHGKKYYQHIVGKGETVYGVSKDFNLTVGDIVLQNPRAIDGITAGDTLQIPFAVPSSSNNNTTQVQKDSNTNGPFIYHKVEAKETIYSLCKQYGISMSKMDSLNPELNEK